jgi:D-glycero-alpha-D-manno-heptose-7-phosphate kinase
MIIRSKAPLRVSFAGGGTDVSPYADERGGLVLNATITKYAYVTLHPRHDDTIQLHSTTYHTTAKYNIDEPLPYDGTLDLVKAVINRVFQDKDAAPTRACGLEFFVHNDAPPGSGLGGSSTMVVALVGAFREWLHTPWTDYDVANLAFQIERVDMRMAGGKQDQYAAAFGGFNFIEFQRDRVIVNPLRIRRSTLNELQHNLLLCYTGTTRRSARIIESQVQNYREGATDAVRAMDELKRLAVEMKKSLLVDNLDDFGALLHDAWLSKRQMAAQISNAQIDELYEAARKAGALGGKISGAGGGGYMFFFCPNNTKYGVAEALEKLGAQVVDFGFDLEGMQTWCVR